MTLNKKSECEFTHVHIILGVIFISFLLRYFVEFSFNIFQSLNFGIILVIIYVTILIKVFSIACYEMETLIKLRKVNHV